MPNVITCPQCAMQLRVPDTIVPGSQVRCPRCSVTFAVPQASSVPPAAPAGQFTAAQSMGGASAPLGPSAREHLGFEYQDTAHRPGGKGAGLAGITADYTFDLGTWFQVALNQYGAVFGPMLGYGFIIFAISLLGFAPYIGSCFEFIIYFFVLFAMYAGYVVACLKQMRGQGWQFGDLFLGWNYWVPLFVVNLLKIAVVLICWAPSMVVGVLGFVQLLNQASGQTTAPTIGSTGQVVTVRAGPPAGPDFTLLIVAGLLYVLAAVPCLCVYVRLFLFTPWLIVDRGCGPIEAIKGNWALTEGHFWGWLGVTFLLWLAFIISLAPCYLGMPFFLPLYYLFLNAAWMRITGPEMAGGPL